MFAVHTGVWIRYRRFLSVITERHKRAEAAFIDAYKCFKERPEAITREDFEAQRTTAEALHLEVESFYAFAKILLDRVAYFFGKPKTAWGSSYNKLITENRQVLVERGAARLVELLDELQRRIADVRTLLIEHQSDPRWGRGTTWGEGGAHITVIVDIPSSSGFS
jgi:hypothetical protein